MAKKPTKKPTKKSSDARRPKTAASKRAATSKGRPAERKSKPGGQGKNRRATGRQSGESASDALVGLLESPLVADVLAAGAAAALATFTHHSLTRKNEGSKEALKDAARAAATAMGARLSTEFDEIMKSARKNAKGVKA